MALLTLLTDFGQDDYYVAAVKGTVLRLAPETTLVDLSHGIPPGDVRAASFVLAAVVPTFPQETVHLAVVDPGVGSGRRILVGEGTGRVFVAPDNGLLTPLLAGLELRSVAREELFLPGPGHTFHGRDRFAPVAAALLRGEPFADLGPPVSDPARLEITPPSRDRRRLTGEVAHVDRFGNLVTDIPSAWIEGRRFELLLGDHRVRRWATHYLEIPFGQPAVLPGSLGTLEISLRDDDLAARWGTRRGERVEVRFR